MLDDLIRVDYLEGTVLERKSVVQIGAAMSIQEKVVAYPPS